MNSTVSARLTPAPITKEDARMGLQIALEDLSDARRAHANGAGALLEAQTAQQKARQLEKDTEAFIIQSNPDDIFTPRKTSQADKDAYLRAAMGDTYKARAMAEEALVAATYEATITTAALEAAALSVQGLTAILNSFKE